MSTTFQGMESPVRRRARVKSLERIAEIRSVAEGAEWSDPRELAALRHMLMIAETFERTNVGVGCRALGSALGVNHDLAAALIRSLERRGWVIRFPQPRPRVHNYKIQVPPRGLTFLKSADIPKERKSGTEGEEPFRNVREPFGAVAALRRRRRRRLSE